MVIWGGWEKTRATRGGTVAETNTANSSKGILSPEEHLWAQAQAQANTQHFLPVSHTDGHA